MNIQEEKKVIKYLNMGLTIKEIAKLLDKGQRTIERLIKEKSLRLATMNQEDIKNKAFKLIDSGLSYSQTAKQMRVTKQTIYNWNRERKKKL